MPRKPASVELKGGKGPRQRVWELIRDCASRDKAFKFLDVASNDIELETVRDYVLSLERAEIVKREPEQRKHGKRHEKAEFRLVRDEGIDAPRVRRDGTRVTQGLAQEQMWRTLRMLKGDTNARELAAHAGTPEIKVAQIAANDYLHHLNAAGYVECTREGKGVGRGGILARYRLVKNTGPRAPMVSRTKALYDPNLGEMVGVAPVTEEDAIYGR